MTELRLEDLLGFRKQRSEQPHIQILELPEAEVIAAKSKPAQLAGIDLYQGDSVLHHREIHTDIVLLQRYTHCRPIHVLPASSYILKLPIPDHPESHPWLPRGRSAVKVSLESGCGF